MPLVPPRLFRGGWLASSLAALAACATVPSSSAPTATDSASEPSSQPATTVAERGTCELFSPDGAPVPVYSSSGVTHLPSGSPVQCIGRRYVPPPDAVYELAEADPPTLGSDSDLVELRVDGRLVWTGESHLVRPSQGTPDGRWLVHMAEVGRGDCRHCRAWILTPSRRAIALGGVSCESNWAFSPDGRFLAFGSWELRVFALELDEAVQAAEHPSITSPAYAPDGRLFARRNVGVTDPGPGHYGEHWQCVEQVEGAWQVAHPGAPQLFEECEECSCGPDELPPAPVVDASGLARCPLPPAEQHPVSF